MTTLYNVPTRDAPIDQNGRTHYRPEFRTVRAHGYHRDDAPYSEPIRKTLVLGRVWRGGLQSQVDAVVAALEPYEQGFVYGGAAGPTAQSLDLGRCWVGNLQRQLSKANDAAGDVDISELLMTLTKLANALGGGATNGAQMADAVRNVRRARDGILGSLVSGLGHAVSAVGHFGAGLGEAVSAAPHILHGGGSGASGGESESESESEDGGLPGALASLNKRNTDQLRRMNDSNASFWIGRNGPNHTTTSDAGLSPDAREAVHRFNTATNPMDKNRAWSDMNRAFWADRAKR